MNEHTHIIKAGEFKAHCLELMDTVKREHVEFVITKRGIAVARLVPIEEKKVSPFGFMKNTVVYMDDLISPIDVSWDAADE